MFPLPLQGEGRRESGGVRGVKAENDAMGLAAVPCNFSRRPLFALTRG